jgi:AcrR family transcriptional regulator
LAGAPIVASPWLRTLDREQERAIKREAVLRVAAQLFNEFGYHATSLAMVAERLQVTKPTLYYYVQNKEEILFECVRLGLELLRSAIAAAAASGGTALDKLEAAMHEYALIVTRDFGMCLIRVGEDPLAAEGRKTLRRLKAEIDHEFRSLIEQGIAEGSLAPCDAKLAAFALAGGLSWIGRWFDPHGPLSAEEIARHSTAVLMNGLSARPTAAPALRRRKSVSKSERNA